MKRLKVDGIEAARVLNTLAFCSQVIVEQTSEGITLIVGDDFAVPDLSLGLVSETIWDGAVGINVKRSDTAVEIWQDEWEWRLARIEGRLENHQLFGVNRALIAAHAAGVNQGKREKVWELRRLLDLKTDS